MVSVCWRHSRTEICPYFVQMGGNFVLDEAGKVLLSHPSKTPLDRPTVDDVLEAVDAADSRSLWGDCEGDTDLADTTEEERRRLRPAFNDVTPLARDSTMRCDRCWKNVQRRPPIVFTVSPGSSHGDLFINDIITKLKFNYTVGLFFFSSSSHFFIFLGFSLMLS